MFDHLREIKSFRLWCKLPVVIELNDQKVMRDVGARAYTIMADIAQLAGFHTLDQLDLKLGDDGQLMIVYDDDRFDFALRIQQQAIVVERRGSSLEAFHEWYIGLAPHFSDLVTRVCEGITEAVGRRIAVQRAYYLFSFLLLDLRHKESGRSLPNYEVIGSLIKGLPDDSGRLSDSRDVFRTAGRIDVTFSRWLSDEDRHWVERYDVEAPANNAGELLAFDFTFIGETFSNPESGERSPFNPKEFFERYDTPYGQFLRKRVIGTFLADLLATSTFRSVRALS